MMDFSDPAQQTARALEQALSRYRRELELDPGNFEALHGIGVLFGQAGRFEEALKFFAEAAVVQPDNYAAHYHEGRALQALERFGEALAAYDKALSLKPNYAAAHFNRGTVLKELQRYPEALAAYDTALAHDMRSAEIYHHRGEVLAGLRRHDEALDSYAGALALKPDFAEAYKNLGITQDALRHYDAALASFDKALALNPDYADAYANRGYTLQNLRRYDEAAADYEKAVSIDPECAEAHFNKSRLKLLLGEYAEGWQLYEWRWKVGRNKIYARRFGQELWLGDQPVSGKTVLLHAEQGFGDVIQFIRYLPMVEALGARVILGVHPDLVPLLRSLNGSFTMVTSVDALPAFDLHCPLMSLPLVFKTAADGIPATVPYLFADPDKRARWRERLGKKTAPRIGMAWSGSPAHRSDRQRSLALRTLEPLLNLNFEFHSLQKEIRVEDRAALAEFTRLRSHELELHDFADTAALIAEMDIIIAADTAAAHLAGALGKAAWILLPFAPDYRWMTERSDSPWYPTARLFRQAGIGDWNGVVREVCAALRQADFP